MASRPLIGFEEDLLLFSFSFLPSIVPLFQVIRSHDLGNWTLQIKYPHLRDNGVYECQINTEPKMSLSYSLNVVGKRNYQHVGIIASRMFSFVSRVNELSIRCGLKAFIEYIAARYVIVQGLTKTILFCT